MKFHLMSLLYAVFISIGFFTVLSIAHDEQQKYCEVKFKASMATLPCTELNQHVYEVRM